MSALRHWLGGDVLGPRKNGRRDFEVTPVANAAEAIVAAERNTFDLLISDLGMPEIRAIQRVPAIALSGFGMESDVAESKRAGFQLHLTKPVDSSNSSLR